MLGSLSLSFFDEDRTSIAILDGTKFGVKFLEGETHDWKIDVTSHPVENGSDISDHIQPQPRVVTITARESEAALNLVQITSGSGRGRVENAKTFLYELYRSRKVVMLTTRLHTYQKMVAVSITQSSKAGDGKSLPWSVTFREIETVESGSVKLAAMEKEKTKTALTKTKGAGSKTVETGKKAPIPATPAEAPKVASLARKGFDALFGGTP